MVTQVRADDLTAIRGIGASRQRWLAQEFGVRTYVQLAALAPDEIEARLKSAGKLSSRAEVEGWLAQAAELAAATPTPAEQDWTPAATFVVELQQHQGAADRSAWRTVVHYLEADLGQTWPDVEIDGVCDWLRRRVVGLQPELPAVQVAVQPVMEQAPPVAAPVALRARQVRVSQPPHYSAALDMTQPVPPLLGHVRHGAPISFELELEPADAGQSQPLAPADYAARFQLHNLSRSGKPELLDMQPVGPAGDARLSRADQQSPLGAGPLWVEHPHQPRRASGRNTVAAAQAQRALGRA